jgi:hypothetical protein
MKDEGLKFLIQNKSTGKFFKERVRMLRGCPQAQLLNKNIATTLRKTLLFVQGQKTGATLSITTLSIMTFSTVTLSIRAWL